MWGARPDPVSCQQRALALPHLAATTSGSRHSKGDPMGVECSYYLLPRPNTFQPTGDQVRQFVDILRRDGWVWAQPVAKEEGTRLGGPATAQELSIADGLRLLPASGVPARDLCFFWSFPDWDRTQARFPFVVEPDPEQGFTSWYYDLQLHLMAAGYFAHEREETVELLADTHCSCGQELDWSKVEGEWYSRRRPATPPVEPTRAHDVEGFRALYREFFGGFEGVGIAYSPISALSRLQDRCPACGQPFDPSTRIARARDPMTLKPCTIPGGITYRFALMIDCGKSLPIYIDPTRPNPIQPELLDLCQRHFGTDFYDVGAYG
jgi:hypothetical protein